MTISDRWTRVVMSSVLAVGVSGMASATWTDFYVVKTQTSNSGINLDVYKLYARFNGPTDTVLNAFNLDRTTSSGILNGFYHKDNFTGNCGVLTTSFGSWAPSLTGSATVNRPFDSYLTVGGLPTAPNGTSADMSWVTRSPGAVLTSHLVSSAVGSLRVVRSQVASAKPATPPTRSSSVSSS